MVVMNLRASITSVSPVIHDIQHDLGMSSTMISLLTTIPVLCMGVFALLAGWFSTKFGEERTILLCVALIGAATFSRLFAHTPVALLLTAFFSGIGIAVASPLVLGFIKRNYPRHSSAMVGIYSAGMGVGAAISAGLVIQVSTNLSSSWNGGLAFWAIFAVAGIIFWLPIVKNSQKESRSMAHVKLPWKNPYVWLLVGAFGLQSGIYYSISTWLAPLVESLGYTELEAAASVTIFQIVLMISGLVFPLLVNYSSVRRRWLFILAGSTLLGLVGMLLWGDAVNPGFFVALIGIGAGGLFPIVMILPLDATANARETSQWTAMIQFGGYIISAAIPLGLGMVKDITGSYDYTFGTLIVVVVLLIILIFWVREPEENGMQK